MLKMYLSTLTFFQKCLLTAIALFLCITYFFFLDTYLTFVILSIIVLPAFLSTYWLIKLAIDFAFDKVVKTKTA